MLRHLISFPSNFACKVRWSSHWTCPWVFLRSAGLNYLSLTYLSGTRLTGPLDSPFLKRKRCLFHVKMQLVTGLGSAASSPLSSPSSAAAHREFLFSCHYHIQYGVRHLEQLLKGANLKPGSAGAGTVYVSSADCWRRRWEASAGPVPSTPFPTGVPRHFSLQPL